MDHQENVLEEQGCLKEDNQQVVNEEGKHCEFYVQRKRRYCKFQPVEGSKFCPAHGVDQQKIECPYEKGMFISAKKFEKHLQNCPMIKNKEKQQSNKWFNKGVNLKTDSKVEQHVPSYSSITGVDPQLLLKAISKIVLLYEKCFKKNAISYISSTEQQKIKDLTNDHTQAYLLAESALKAHLLKEDIIYIQFGAGKGILSYHIALKIKELYKKNSKNVLLERQSRRNKFDRFMKDNPFFQRYKSDVSDFDVKEMCVVMANTAKNKNSQLNLEKEIAELNDMKIVGVCKHMCGGALDISVRALMKTKMSGCILASCCHHLCSYETYLNNSFFEEEGFSAEEISVMFKISSWGTKLSTIKPEDINLSELAKVLHSELEGKKKVMIGRMCKRLIDFGRAKILKCEVERYCSDQITPQNFVIISQ